MKESVFVLFYTIVTHYMQAKHTHPLLAAPLTDIRSTVLTSRSQNLSLIEVSLEVCEAALASSPVVVVSSVLLSVHGCCMCYVYANRLEIQRFGFIVMLCFISRGSLRLLEWVSLNKLQSGRCYAGIQTSQ
jgi:hypothetical protein